MKIVNVNIHRKTNKDKSVTFALRWLRGDGQKYHREYLWRTEPDPTKTSLRQWEREAALAQKQKIDYLNGRAREFIIPAAVELAASRYLDSKAGDLSESTLTRAGRTLSRLAEFLRAQAGPRNVSGLTIVHIAQFRDHLLHDLDQSPATVNVALHDLSSWFEWCIGESHACDNPARKTNKAKAKDVRQKGRVAIQGPGELKRLLQSIEYDCDAASVAMLAFTGARISEAANLQWDDFDPWLLTLQVGARTKKQRTKKHFRLIPVCPVLLPHLMVLKMHNTEGPYIIGRNRGQTRVTSQMTKLLKPFGLSPHDLRRWYRTALESLVPAVPTRLIDELLGHKTSRTRAAYTPASNTAATRPVVQALARWYNAGRKDDHDE